MKQFLSEIDIIIYIKYIIIIIIIIISFQLKDCFILYFILYS